MQAKAGTMPLLDQTDTLKVALIPSPPLDVMPQGASWPRNSHERRHVDGFLSSSFLAPSAKAETGLVLYNQEEGEGSREQTRFCGSKKEDQTPDFIQR